MLKQTEFNPEIIIKKLVFISSHSITHQSVLTMQGKFILKNLTFR